MNSFDTKINDFWERAKSIYNPLQQKFGNKDYYIFQTLYQENPDLMIIGLNPGGNGEKGAKELTQGCNSYTEYGYYNENPISWFKTLCKIFNYPDNVILKDVLDNCVGCNRYYFNTGNQNGLKEISKELVEEGIRFDLKSGLMLNELIEIIKPKHIIALHKDVFCHIAKSGKTTFNGKQMGYSNLNGGIPVLFIPNPSPINAKYFNSKEKLINWAETIERFILMK